MYYFADTGDGWIWLAAAGLTLLLISFILESIRCSRLQKENDTLLHLANTKKGDLHPTVLSAAGRLSLAAGESFLHAPYPLWLVTPTGRILASNTALQNLSGGKIHGTMEELDAALGMSLSRYVGSRPQPIQNPVYVREHESDGSIRHRTFQAVRWPVQGTGKRIGWVFSLHEQTQAYERRHSQDAFEQQIVRYLRHAAERAYRYSMIPGREETSSLASLAEEMVTISRYLDSLHHHVRSPQRQERTDLVSIIRSRVEEVKSTRKDKHLNIVTTLPKSAFVLGNGSEFSLAFQILCDLITSTMETAHSMRINLSENKGEILVTLSAPEKKLRFSNDEELTAFGHTDTTLAPDIRFQRLQLAVVKQIIGKYHSTLTISSDPTFGTVYSLAFLAASSRHSPERS